MLLFRLSDLPRRVRRLVPPLPLDPTGEALELEAQAATVGWTLLPTLLDPGNKRMQRRVARLLALYAETEGQPRAMIEALAPQMEELMGDYRLARCLARTVEDAAYQFVAPPPPLPHEPAALRALCYRRAGERHQGYVPLAERAAFMTAIAAELEATPEQLEAALWADRAAAALLQRKADADEEDVLEPARVIARYNAAAVATVVAASSWVALHLDATETAALKDLYRHARALHVGVEITQGSDGMLTLMLYGPGSRALVRSRAAMSGHNGAAEARENGDEAAAEAEPPQGEALDEEGVAEEAAGGNGTEQAELRVPAAGGGPVAAVVARLARRHAGAVRGGWTRLLGFERRLYHVDLAGEPLAALSAGADAEIAAARGAALYDSAVEESFARAFHAQESSGRGGVARGWTLQREPRTVVVETTVFLPDFAFRRGDVEVYGEVIGFYTEDYLSRKTRKLAALRGRIPLLLMVERDLAPIFAATGFPLVTYKAGRQISVSEVISTLEQDFDPFARRRERAYKVLAHLCTTAGPHLSEEELAATTGCAGRSELLALWTELLAGVAVRDGVAVGRQRDSMAGAEGDSIASEQEHGTAHERQGTPAMERPRAVAETRALYDGGNGAGGGFARRYLPGYGLIDGGALAAAQEALTRLLHEASEQIPLDDALRCVTQAGVHDPDEALLERLGAVVTRDGLFGEAHLQLPRGGDIEGNAERL